MPRNDGQNGTPMNIALVWAATTRPNFDLKQLARALQAQFDNDIEPFWQVRTNIFCVDQVTDDYAVLRVGNSSSQAGALGFHEESPNGFPLGWAFIEDSFKYHTDLRVTIGHEAHEMRVNSKTSKPRVIRRPSDGSIYVVEVCDAVEAETYAGAEGVPLSNFVYPSWFDERDKTGRYDHMGLCKEPFELRPGGYMPVDQGRGWTQIFGPQLGQRPFARHSRVGQIIGLPPMTDKERAAVPAAHESDLAGLLNL